MKIAGTAILVTGANRGLGRVLVVGDAIHR
jgi:NAD(P)-dependent dehydrogenase (short-subunit alcohol dehydrogenase family)